MNLEEVKKRHPLHKVFYADWSMRRGVAILAEDEDFNTMDGKFLPYDDTLYPNILAFLKSCERPALLILEATFESFNLSQRQEIRDYCESNGHFIYTVPNRLTTKARVRAGFSAAKTSDTIHADLEDVQAIRHEVEYGVELRQWRLELPDEDYLKAYNGVSRRLMELRSHGTMKKRPRSPGYVLESDQSVYGKQLAAKLGPVANAPEFVQRAFGKDGKWNETAIVTLGVLAEFCKTRRMFDRVSGLHAAAYGSQARSNLMFWVYAGGGTRGKLNPVTRKRDDITLTEFRRAARQVWRALI